MPGRPLFDELRHPRDKRGRFTKSRTVKASAKDKAAARAVAGAFAPSRDAQGSGGKAYLENISGGRSRDLSGLPEVNTALRAGDENAPGVAGFDKATVTLPDDVLLSRLVPGSAFGSTDPQTLEGMKVRDAGFAPAQLDVIPAEQGAVRMHMAVPAGTKAVVNPATGEVVLDRDTEMVMAKVQPNAAGGHDMYLTVLPKVGAKSDGKTAGPAPVKNTDKGGSPTGGDQVRADLMKLKVADLQSQMRDRGLTPGRKRKSELVDALVADEMGHEGSSPDAPAIKAVPASVDDRVRSAVEDVVRGAGGRSGDLVSLAKVRDELGGLARADVDAALLRLDRARVIQLEPDPHRITLSDRAKAAAIPLGGEDMHLVSVIKPIDKGPTKKVKKVKAAAGPGGPEAIQQQWEQTKADLLQQWPATAQPMVDELADQAERAVADDDLGALGSLAVSAGVIAAVALLMGGKGTSLARDAAAGVVAEAAGQGVRIDAPGKPGADRVRQTADAVAHIIAAGYASGAGRAALQLAGAAPAEVRAAVERHLTDLGASSNGLVGDNVGALLSAAQFAGRLSVLAEHPADSYVSVETNDHAECVNCADVASTEYPTLAAALLDYPGGGTFRACLGKWRCRGFVKPVWH